MALLLSEVALLSSQERLRTLRASLGTAKVPAALDEAADTAVIPLPAVLPAGLPPCSTLLLP